MEVVVHCSGKGDVLCSGGKITKSEVHSSQHFMSILHIYNISIFLIK